MVQFNTACILSPGFDSPYTKSKDEQRQSVHFEKSASRYCTCAFRFFIILWIDSLTTLHNRNQLATLGSPGLGLHRLCQRASWTKRYCWQYPDSRIFLPIGLADPCNLHRLLPIDSYGHQMLISTIASSGTRGLEP